MNGLFNPGFIAPTPNVFGAIGSQASSSNSSGSGNSDHMDPFLWLGPIGSSLPSSNNYSPPSNDEYTNGIPYLPETQSLGNICGNCDRSSPENHCFDCSDSLCNRCVIIHLRNLSFKQHTIQKIQNSSPTLTGRILNNYPTPPQSRIELENQCDMHFEVMRCVCDNCKILVCQECTLRDHKDHQYTPIEKYIERPQSIIQLLMDKGGIGKQQIKQNIDRILQFSQHLERDTNEIIQRSRKNGLRIGALSTIHQGIRNEEQERTIIDMIEKFRQQKITNFHDQTSGLRTALAGIASVTDDLKKLSHSFNDMNHYQLAKQLIESDHKIEHFLKQTRKLSPTSVNVNQFVQSIDLSTGIPTTAEDNFIGELQRLMQRTKTSHSNTAHSITSNTNISNLSSALIPSTSVAALATINGTNSPSMLPPTNNITNNITNNNNNINGNRSIRRPITRNNRTYQNNNQTMQTGLPTLVGITWNNTQNLMNGSEMQLFTLPAQTFAGGANRVSPEPRAYGQCIFNSDTRVSIVQREHPSHSFAYDGSLDGQLSRPWGVCVDKDGNIIIGDRRNNRIQIFYPDGSFKFAFGTKGTGDGQLELPAGVTTDRQNRIIVADKDNHRIQIFSSTGRFILKFGSYGRDLGEFQYPWDVAVNSVGNIIATDTRNHRIQMFTSNGHYLTKFSFDNAYYEKHLKSHITPRGVAFAPDGDILVTDFENHRIMKLDSSLSMVCDLLCLDSLI